MWKIVILHHAAYTSTTATHGATLAMRWGFENLGITAVMQGHNHMYERLNVGEIPYFVTGNSGDTLYPVTVPSANSVIYRDGTGDNFGYILVTADTAHITFTAYKWDGTVFDTYTVNSEIDKQRPVVYDLFFSDNFDPQNEPDWKQIATVSSTSNSYLWKFGRFFRSDRCRIAMRAKNSRGERSDFTISAADFSINRKKIASPTIISPTDGDVIDRYVEIIFNSEGLVNTYSQRTFYQIYYSSVNAGIASTAVAQNIAINTDPILWNTIDLSPADDYVLQIFLEDDAGNVSESVIIKNLKVSNEGVFIVDTKPPVGAIILNNNDIFTKSRDVTATIKSYDVSTGVHSLQLIDGLTESAPDGPADNKSFRLSLGDAVKTVELLMQDFGGNRNAEEIQRVFEVLLEIDSVVDIDFNRSNGTLYAITSGSGNYLYKVASFPSLLATFDNLPTSVCVSGTIVYVGATTVENTGILYSHNGVEITTIYTFSTADSIINCMVMHEEELYIGMENGSVYSYVDNEMTEISVLNNPIDFLYSDGSTLYLTQKNDLDVYIYNGSTFIKAGS